MTQNEKVLRIMCKDCIDTRKAAQKYILSLTKRVSEIRRMGYEIPDRQVKTANGKRYKEYFLSDKDREKVRAAYGI